VNPASPTTACIVVGGGPGGVVLTLLLARSGVDVTLLEGHTDFDRDFRGDTIHPSTLDVLDQLGLADRLHELPHAKMRAMKLVTPSGPVEVARFHELRTRFPYVMMMPQSRFLEFVAAEARKLPNCRIVMGATVHDLLRTEGVVTGVRVRGGDGDRELRAPLTVAADGRFSKVRQLAGFEPVRQSPPMDVVWLRLPRRPGDDHDEGSLITGGGRLLVLLGRTDEWQVGYVLPKGHYQRLKEAGLPAIRQALVQLVPWFGDRVETLTDWRQLTLLSVDASRLPRWHRPGLLVIGDAAHVMSPVGGVGINVAIGDAVEAANVLAEPLRRGVVDDRLLAEVQRRRELPVRAIQRLQAFLQRRIVSEAIDPNRPFRLPLPLRILLSIPGLRRLPARMIGYGLRRVRVERPEGIAG
jgi:2-polyprenyl-6-methoxyphenol hydroxylase-like FAD-dependent oxidoreductase